MPIGVDQEGRWKVGEAEVLDRSAGSVEKDGKG